MLKLGPITIMFTSEHDNYKLLVNKAYEVHQLIWYDGMMTEEGQAKIREADAELSYAISLVPASDIENV